MTGCQPLRIAVNAWFLDQPGTGSGQYLQGLLRSLPGLAGEHQFLLVAPPGRIELQMPGLQVRFQALTSPFWHSDLGKVLFEQVAFPWACRRWGADVAHVPYWGSPLRPPVPTVVTVHDLIPLLLPAYRGGPAVRLYTRLVAASSQRAAIVLTDSLASKRDAEAHLGLPAERVHSVYLAAAPHFRPEPQEEDEAIRQNYGLPPRYVLYLAGHDVRKNVATLIEAFATVAQADDDVTLAVGGRLPEHSRPPLYDPRPLVEALGLSEDVRFLGWVEEDHKPALYRGAACAVFPSRYEGFGFPVLEALACGTPLVTSNTSSIPELAGDAAFAVDPDDVAGLAGAMLGCLVDASLASELRQRGPQQAARFRWADTARQTLAAYQQAAGGDRDG
jgi:glycosyltransferase involved in cell wall biosynthesis